MLAPRARPNVVLVLADDLPWELFPHPSADGDAARPLLPHIAALVGEGLSLSRHYSAPLCAPTRASLFSGRWPHRVYDESKMSSCRGMSPAMLSLAEKLKREAGYSTHQLGKWHAGHVTLSYTPWNRGFDTATGFLGSGVDHFTR